MDTLAHGGQRASDGKLTTLPKGLGAFSLGLGLAELTAPRALARMIGILPDGRARATLRVFGAREIAAGIGIFARPRRAMPLWMRVAGDAIDLAFLGWAMRSRRTSTQRLLGAMVAVLGVAALDVYAGQRLQQREGGAWPRAREIKHAQITINRPHDEVKARWRELAGDLPNIHNVVFRRAPGGRGTEVSVEFRAPSALKRAIGRVFHSDVEQLTDGDLHKVKQLIELGEIVHSDASVHRGLHAAQPSRSLPSTKEI